MPRAHGNGFIHMSHIDFMVNVEDDLPESHPVEINDVYRKIGQLIAHNLVVSLNVPIYMD